MGMAASQARCLTLMGRKTNVEWEGQQINQARLALANQSANLFNQMLGLQVPDCPDTTDFTKTQYSFSDGLNASVIESFYQLSTPDPEYNYVVTHYYNTNVYTGSLKKLNDPQVQMSMGTTYTAADYQEAITQRKEAKLAFEAALDETPLNSDTQPRTVTATGTDYDIETAGATVTYTRVTAGDRDALEALLTQGAFTGYYTVDDLIAEGVYKNGDDYVTKADIDLVVASGGTGNLTVYTADSALTDLQTAYNEASTLVSTIESEFAAEFVGNAPLTRLTSLTQDQLVELSQCCKDFENEGITANLLNYFTKSENGNYIYSGDGVYTFNLNGVPQYTTLADLANSYEAANDPPGNDVDSQHKLAYCNASYIQTKIEKTEKALLETDGHGRFTSVRFEDDTVKYTLNCESVTDQVAYDDAMNQYYYKVREYEKIVADINAKTEIIHQEDRTLELQLKKLDTEQSALSNEIDAVKKVISKSVESGFKTFGE